MNTSTTTPLLVLGTALALVTLSGCGGPPADQHTDSRDHHATASAPDPSTPPKGSAEAGDLVIEDAWLAEPANPSMTAGYLTISNTGDEDITLTEAATSLSDRTELHTVETTESGAAQMVPVDDIPIPAGETVELASGGLHIMVLDIADPPQVGDTATITLTFNNGETVQVDAPVLERTGSSGHHH